MPKDITHWAIAKKISQRLDDPKASDVINKYKDLYYIGAVSFDIPYYCIGKKADKVSSISDNLHEPIKGNSLKVIHNILLGYSDEIPEYVIAFILGTITHIIVDGTFHPLIYYYTGNYYDADISKRNIAACRHREFESKLDLFFKKRANLENSNTAIKSFFNKKISKNNFFKILSLEYYNKKNFKSSSIKGLFFTYLSLQYLFNKKAIYFTLRFLNKIFKSRFSKTLALFYPSENAVDFDFYTNKIHYIHPVTGEQFNESMIDLEEKAVNRAVNLFNKFRNTTDKTELLKILQNIQVPSLETGLGKYSSKEMKYFK